MGLQKYRADEKGSECSNGAIPWYSMWMGGPSLALIRNCPTPWGPRTVYVRGEPDTWFSIPAACEIRMHGKRHRITGYFTWKDSDWEFRVHTQYHHLFPAKKESTIA